MILPTLIGLLNENTMAQVKAKVATAVSPLAQFIGKEQTITRLLPTVQDLLRDENADVKLSMLKGLISLIESLDQEILQGPLLQSVQNLTKDSS